MHSSEVSHDCWQAACLSQVAVPGFRRAVTFVSIQVVFELPLGYQDVKVTRLLKEAQVPHGDVAGEHPLELPAPGILILCLHQDANVIWSQDVQDRRIEILQTRATQAQGETSLKQVSMCLRSLGHKPHGNRTNLGSMVTPTLHRTEENPNSAAQPLLNTLPGGTQGQWL